jgi:hypothetical protein
MLEFTLTHPAELKIPLCAAHQEYITTPHQEQLAYPLARKYTHPMDRLVDPHYFNEWFLFKFGREYDPRTDRHILEIWLQANARLDPLDPPPYTRPTPTKRTT